MTNVATQSHKFPARATAARNADEGDVFQTLLGEFIRVDAASSDELDVEYMDRDGQPIETVSRAIFAARAGFEGYKLIRQGWVAGSPFGFVAKTPNCPECGAFVCVTPAPGNQPEAECDCGGYLCASDLIDGGNFVVEY